MRLTKAAEILGVPAATIFDWCDSGELEITGYFGEYFVSDESVAKFVKAIDRYKARKHERTRRKDRDRPLPDYYIRVSAVAERLNMPIHQARLLAGARVFDARKVNGWWVLDGGLIDLFLREHPDKVYKTAASVVAQFREDEKA